MNPDSHLMRKVHETVKLYRAAHSLSDTDSHFFSNQRIRVRTVCSICVPLHKNTSVRKLGDEKYSRNFKGILS